jgi:Protein of unknown function (DUF2975)
VNPPRPTSVSSAGYYLVSALVVLSVVIGCLIIVNELVGAARGGDMPVGSLSVDAALAPDHLRSLPHGIKVHDDLRLSAEVVDPTSAQLLLATGTQVGPLALLIASLWLLRALARSVREREPFGEANVRRLRALGFLLVLGSPAVAVVNWALRLALGNTSPLSDLSTAGLSIQAAPLIAGLGAFVLAEVFAHGVRLREDVEATI